MKNKSEKKSKNQKKKEKNILANKPPTPSTTGVQTAYL
jgi:hypothetical protein